MDVNERTAFPAEDYDKNGNLKKIRWRMVKKLLKYEFKSVLYPLCIVIAVLFGLTIFACMDTKTEDEFFLGLPLILYIYAIVATLFLPIGLSTSRYYKNFFKGEGYLTFSIPASMEEHVFAKHFSGIISTLLGGLACAISVTIVVAFTGETDTGAGVEVITPTFLSVVEDLLILLEVLIGIFTVSGAVTCWSQKYEKRSQIVVRVVIAYVLFLVLQTTLFSFLDNGWLRFFFTDLGAHVLDFIIIFVFAGIIAFSIYYELKFLKKKLNLK